jgi:AraC-like DNA-binding protein
MGKSPDKILLLLIIVITAGCGRDSAGNFAISNWQIKNGDTRTEEPLRLSNNWQPYSRKMPSFRDILKHNLNEDEIFWLKGEFQLKKITRGIYGVSIRGRTRPAKVFINSFPIEKSGGRKLINSYAPDRYLIPNDCLRKGVNEILIQTRPAAGVTAMTEEIRMAEGGSWDHETLVSDLVYTHVPLAVMLFNLSLLFPPLVFFLLNRKIRMLGFSSSVLAMFIVFIAFQFIPARYTGSLTPRIHLALIPVFGFLLVKSVQSLYRVNLRIINRIIAAGSTVFFLTILLLDKNISEAYAPFALLLGMCVTIPLSLAILYKINRRKRNLPQYIAAILFVGLALVIGLYEIINFIADGPFAFLSPIYASPLFVVSYMIIMAREYMRSIAGMGAFHRAIQDREKKKDNEPAITGINEIKLEAVIDFIRNNYNRELSREGLACTVDISTDYMSRMFKKYTGKKMGEFINEIRVHEAAELLKSRDRKIIDIALSVGFESLTTFNRVFKSVTGMTPGWYRRKNVSQKEQCVIRDTYRPQSETDVIRQDVKGSHSLPADPLSSGSRPGIPKGSCR